MPPTHPIAVRPRMIAMPRPMRRSGHRRQTCPTCSALSAPARTASATAPATRKKTPQPRSRRSTRIPRLSVRVGGPRTGRTSRSGVPRGPLVRAPPPARTSVDGGEEARDQREHRRHEAKRGECKPGCRGEARSGPQEDPRHGWDPYERRKQGREPEPRAPTQVAQSQRKPSRQKKPDDGAQDEETAEDRKSVV